MSELIDEVREGFSAYRGRRTLHDVHHTLNWAELVEVTGQWAKVATLMVEHTSKLCEAVSILADRMNKLEAAIEELKGSPK